MKCEPIKKELKTGDVADVESMVKMAYSWRKDYERRIGRENNDFLQEDMAEEIDLYVTRAAYNAYKNKLISKKNYQKIVAVFWNEWSILCLRIKEIEPQLDDIHRLCGDYKGL